MSIFGIPRAFFNRVRQTHRDRNLHPVGSFLIDVGNQRLTMYVYPPGVDHPPEHDTAVIQGQDGWSMLILDMGPSQAVRDEWARMESRGLLTMQPNGYPEHVMPGALGEPSGKAVIQ